MNSVLTLIPKLLEATNGTTLRWEIGDSDSQYVTHISSLKIKIVSYADHDTGNSIFEIAIYKMDPFVESVIDSHVADKYDEQFELLQLLFDSARRSGNGVDVIVSQLIAELDKIDVEK